MNFCSKCGATVQPADQFCASCGAPLLASLESASQGCSFIVTLMLCWSLGMLGVHRFYTKNTGYGLLQLLTCGGLGVWALIDFIMILSGSYRDGEGRPLVRDY